MAIAQAVDLLNKYKRHDALELNIKMGDVLCTLPTPHATPETPSSFWQGISKASCVDTNEVVVGPGGRRRPLVVVTVLTQAEADDVRWCGWWWLCAAGLETDPSKRKDAVEAYQRALAFDPGNKRAQHGLGATKAHHPIHSEAFPFGCRDTGLPLSGFVALSDFVALVLACAEKVERLMQGLDPGDAMDDSAEDEAPEDDEVRTRSCQGACWPWLWL